MTEVVGPPLAISCRQGAFLRCWVTSNVVCAWPRRTAALFCIIPVRDVPYGTCRFRRVGSLGPAGITRHASRVKKNVFSTYTQAHHHAWTSPGQTSPCGRRHPGPTRLAWDGMIFFFFWNESRGRVGILYCGCVSAECRACGGAIVRFGAVGASLGRSRPGAWGLGEV